MNDNDTPGTRFIPQSEVQRRVPYSRVQIWRLEKQGRFPKRVRIGPNRVAWVETEVEAWINDRLAEREAGR